MAKCTQPAAEEASHESEKLAQELLDNFPALVYVVDADGRFLLTNQRLDVLLGAAAGQAIGKTREDFLPTEIADEHRKNDLEIIRSGRASASEEENLEPDGKHVYSSVKFPLHDARGRIYAIGGISTDITERKQTEQALRASEERYHALFDETSDGIALADAATGTILDCNAALCRMVERDKTELLGQPQSILHPPQQLVGGVSPTFRRHRTGTADKSIEDDLISKSGKLVPIEIRAARVEIEGRPCLLGIFRDITERKRAAAETEALARFPAENPNPVLRVEERGAILYANPASESLLRCRVGGYLPPDWREGVVRAAKDHARITLDVKWEERDYSILFVPIPGAGYVNVYARDVTEHRRAEGRLRESEEHFRTLYENTTIGLYRTTPDGSILLANPTLVKMLGLTSQDALSVRNLEVDGFEPSYRRAQFVERVEREGTVTGLEATWTRSDGISLFVRESARAIRDSDGKTLFYDGTVEDITERKKAEDALRESEDRYRSLVDNIPGIIFTIDLAGKITFVSRRTKEILGYEGAEMINKSVLDFIPEEERQRAMEAIQKGMTGVGIKHFETPMIKGSGERAWFECSFARVRKDGRVIGAQGTAVDITERKQAEEALRLSEQAARELAEQLQLVGRVGVAITAGLGLERLMQTIYEEFQLLIPTDTFYVALYDDATGIATFPLHYKDGERRTIPPCDLRETPGLLGQVIDRRRPIYLPDAPNSSIPLVNLPGSLNRSIIVVPLILGDRIVGVLSVQSHAPNAYSQELVQMLERLATQIAIAISNSRLYESVSHGLEATLTALGRTAERRDPYTAGHQRRVTDLALAIARKLEYGEDACSALRTAGMLHDIGKLGVPAEILSKPTALSKIELELIRTHPQAAYEILADVAFPGPVAEIVLQHHERQDGSGYPKKISGDDILPEARILAVADVVEAIASHRPYRPARGIAAALDEIRAGRGTRYNQQVVDACVALFESGEFSFQPASAG